MCGFTVTKEKIKNILIHRGIKENSLKANKWQFCFNSLPLSSNGTNIEMPLKVGSNILVFNGEIFNYKKLDRKAKSDVHYLNNLLIKVKGDIYNFYKESLKWDGFWSIAICKYKGDLFFFTDPLGKKQLYFSKNGISSEIKPLLINDQIDYHPYDEKKFGTHNTNFGKINRAIPGNLYQYSYDLERPFLTDRLDYLYTPQHFDLYETIKQSVEDRMENRYDGISLLLSGGLDSNIILYHLLKYTKDIDIVSFENNEKEEVEKISEFYGIDIRYIKDSYNDHDVLDAVNSYECSLDYGSLIPNYILFRECKNSLVLTGDGSDELFSGYSRSLKNDTWNYDVLKELPYYHNIRIDRMSMRFTKEARSPLMSFPLMRLSRLIPYSKRKNKKVLRDLYEGYLPDFVINGKKKPLRLKQDKEFNKNLIEKTHKNIWQGQRKKLK